MQLKDGKLDLSATDLSNFLGCRHRIALELAEAYGKRHRPIFNDPLLEIQFQRGLAHERAYVESFQIRGQKIVNLADIRDRRAAVVQTLEALQLGADVVVQGALSDGCWYGRPDVIQRVESPSGLGVWSYEVADTKLARETRAGTILQLGLYSEMLGIAQSKSPEYFYVVTPDTVAPIHRYRVNDYAAYVRLVSTRMQQTVGEDDEILARQNYPEPVDLCDICPWSGECKKKRHRDDHLSLVAGISRLQQRELESRDISTLTNLARLPLPLPFKPKRGASETYMRIREQARLQFESRGTVPPLYELQPFKEETGLCRLPNPTPNDIFLDLEGDPFAGDGREYLFGIVTIDPNGTPFYRRFWAFTDHDERQAFESVIDLIMQLWQANEAMHVYHYAPYEPSALNRLMGRYATREQELDKLLRAGRFVDLFAVVRQGVRAGIERYSIKNLEVFYEFDRAVPLSDANRSLLVMEQALELECPDTVPIEVRNLVEGYNKDDCLSTLRLRTWLERLRGELEATGAVVPRPRTQDGEASPTLDERAQRVAELRTKLLMDVPEAPADQTEEQHARWLLAYLLDWHRREDKAGWWEYFRLRDLPEDDLFDEPQAIAGLRYIERVSVVPHRKTGKPTGSVIDRYQYPIQEMEIHERDELKLKDGNQFGDVFRVDRTGLTIDVRKSPARSNMHPSAVFAHTHIGTGVLEEAISRVGRRIADCGIDDATTTSNRVARDLLLTRPPTLRSAKFTQEQHESAVEFAVRIVGDLDGAVLAIQGPPGSGKTYSGAEMICALIKKGKRIGVTANSHKVIRNLLEAVGKAAQRTGTEAKIAHKMDADNVSSDTSPLRTLRTNEKTLDWLVAGKGNVVGGTPWLWARPEFSATVDALFVDEAGQMSLANVLAVSHATKNLILLGDPQQLEQPQKGTHPTGVNSSGLQHLLREDQTIPVHRGIFLPVTWRLAPSICAFTSELFYESRLSSKTGLDRQCLTGTAQFDGSGLWVVEAVHDGNRNSSAEEVDVVADLVTQLTMPGVQWIDENGSSKQMTYADILVVSPYNAQVSRLAERLEIAGVRVGTVDKFQGQEAPVVIYSMATSRPEDAPRGMEFLYSLNRLNVATSRARCAVILVASPRLFEPECRTPRQMKLANALSRYRELARFTGTLGKERSRNRN